MGIRYPLWLEIVATHWLRLSTDLGLSFDLSLSCKLQLIDVIMVSATCQQTILVCFFFLRTVKWVCRKRKETIGWKIRKANLVPRMLEMAFQSSKFQNFLGDMPPDPPRLRGPTTRPLFIQLVILPYPAAYFTFY